MKIFLILTAASLMFITACKKTDSFPDPILPEVQTPDPVSTVTNTWFVFRNANGVDLFTPVEYDKSTFVTDSGKIIISNQTFFLSFNKEWKDSIDIGETNQLKFDYYGYDPYCGGHRTPGFFKTSGEPGGDDLNVTFVKGTLVILKKNKPANNKDANKVEVELILKGVFKKVSSGWGGVTYPYLEFHFKSYEK